MWGTNYVSLLILCTLLSQEIESLFDKNNGESSRLHVRTKRIINESPKGVRQVIHGHVPYIVNIYRNNVSNCAGTILTPYIIATAGHCFRSIATYKVLSGSSARNAGMEHIIVHKTFHKNFHPFQVSTDLVLLVIHPAIDFKRSPNRSINLYNGFVAPGTSGFLSGWGCTGIVDGKMRVATELRTIKVPVISEAACRQEYKDFFAITSERFCTLDADGISGSCKGDSGGPLVVNNQLAGILSWNKAMPHDLSPDVYTNVGEPSIRNWILEFIRSMSMDGF